VIAQYPEQIAGVLEYQEENKRKTSYSPNKAIANQFNESD